MSAKKSGKSESEDAYLNAKNDPELEKKVDKMMGVEESPKSSDEPKSTKVDVKTDSSEPGSAPLLPTDKLPDVAQKDPVKEEPPAAEPTPVSKPEPTPSPETSPDSNLKDEVGLEDPGTNRAVDEIMAADSDELLEKNDSRPATKAAAAAPRKNPIKRFFTAWWRSKPARYLTILLILAGIGAAAAVPKSRYFLLNTAGVRSSASVIVLDETTNQPLKNVDFSINGQAGKTDAQGQAKLSNLRLGPTNLKINKTAFAEVNQPVTVGWGSNPLGEFRLKPVGIQYKFTVTDFLSKKPIVKAEAVSGEASALPNDKGELVLTVPQNDQDNIEVQIKAPDYRTETLKLQIDQKDTQEVQLVPARKHAFVSKRTGTFDVYKVDVDGKNEEKVLLGTGREKADTMALSSHPTKSLAALVSIRDSNRSSNGVIFSTLTLLDLSDNSAIKITQSERVQLIDWVGDKLIYVKIKEGTSKDSVDRHVLASYDLESEQEKELASTNYFNDVLSANGAVYYSPAVHNVNGSVGLFKINPDGSGKKTVYDKEVWNMFRTSYDKISVSMGQEWFELTLANDSLDRMNGAPPVQKSRIYVQGPDSQKSLWADERDGKGALVEYSRDTGKDEVLRSQSGLKNPLQWLTNKHIVYRVNNNQETADYVLSTEGGEPRKIRDVTDTVGIDRWYYY